METKLRPRSLLQAIVLGTLLIQLSIRQSKADSLKVPVPLPQALVAGVTVQDGSFEYGKFSYSSQTRYSAGSIAINTYSGSGLLFASEPPDQVSGSGLSAYTVGFNFKLLDPNATVTGMSIELAANQSGASVALLRAGVGGQPPLEAHQGSQGYKPGDHVTFTHPITGGDVNLAAAISSLSQGEARLVFAAVKFDVAQGGGGTASTPEPSSWALLACGLSLVSLGWCRRRKQRIRLRREDGIR